MKLIKPNIFNNGDKKIIEKEKNISQINFNVFKNNNRPKPANPKDIVIISCFSEFGCEVVGVMYNIPTILRENQGKYVIVMGWYGREFLYRKLADEFWEIKEEFQWLRDYAGAFHNNSKNIKKLEKSLIENKYKVITSYNMGVYFVANKCNKCNSTWAEQTFDKCKFCESEDIVESMIKNVGYWRQRAFKIQSPSISKLKEAEQYLKPNSVGIFARGRKTYGRNLQPEFYIKLINLLEEMGYNPIWLGEKQSCQACPVDHIVDMSRKEEARDLELTLAIISKLRFTVQYWTASTRLASMAGTPYLLFESPDQIWGAGQEGYRRNLCDFSPRKLSICHFKDIYEKHELGINLTKKCINEMEIGNYDDVFDGLEQQDLVKYMKSNNEIRIGS